MDNSPPDILGMNIAHRCKQLILAEFDNALEGMLDSDWRNAFNKVHEETLIGACSTVRLAGKFKMCVPAALVVVVQIRVHKELPKTKGVVILEPRPMPLPGGLFLMPTVVSVGKRVLNLAPEDVWLPPKARLGVVSQGGEWFLRRCIPTDFPRS